MAGLRPIRPADRALVPLTGIIVAVTILAALYWAQKVLIPVALALYLAFLLYPVVAFFQRRGLPRVPAVLTVTALTAVVVLAVGYLVGSQLGSLLGNLPSYQGTIKTKIESLQDVGKDSAWSRLQAMFSDVSTFDPKPDASKGAPGTDSGPPLHVVVDQDALLVLSWVPGYVPSLFELLAQFSLVVVLAIFMLLSREDLRNRFIRVVGYGHMTVTTKAVDDASQRLSRFMLSQFLTNASFGVAVGAGTLVLGLEYPLLWGVVAGLMRYIPYVGSLLAALFPTVQCVVQFTSWWPAILVVGIILGLELIYANVVEPYFYGHSVGVSALAMLVAAAFWTFLWGPVGLVLSTPLTVLVVVLGKYVPALEFLSILLGNQPALDKPSTYYQRLSARDQEEALRIVHDQIKATAPEQVYDALLLPTLVNAGRDRLRGGLDDADARFIQESIDAAAVQVEEAQREHKGQERLTDEAAGVPRARTEIRILGVAARDENDAVALRMLRHLLQGEACELDIVGPEVLSSELLALIEEKEPAAICIAALPPGGLARARYLCKRLRKRFPRLQIMVGRWGLNVAAGHQWKSLRAAGANQVKTGLLQTRNELLAWRPALVDHPGETAAVEKKRPGQKQPQAV
jgi:predicted PurR-regulated permease PerM